MLYQVEWIPADAFLALAKKRGMPEGDESPMDYAEPDDAAQTETRKTFEGAMKLAKEKLEGDWFGCVRIEKLVFIKSRYGDRYDAEAVWHVAHDDSPNEDEPDERPEIDLIDDEHLVAV
jgi:hypothetical protein